MKSIPVSALILVIWKKDLFYADKLVLVIALDFLGRSPEQVEG